MDGKHFWRYDGFIATPNGDLAVVVFTFRGSSATSVKDGIYVMDAKVVMGCLINEEGKTVHSLHLYSMDVCMPNFILFGCPCIYLSFF